MDNLYSSVSKGGCYDTNHYGPRPLPLLKLNYLGEYFTEAEKELVRENLGIHNDSLVREFIAEGKFFKDQKAVEGHESIETIYDAISYLFGDVDAENERILELEAESLILNKLVGSKSVSYEFDENDKKVYLWPELKDIEEGYLYELNSSIKNAFDEIHRVEGKIGELPDGSDALSYIDIKDSEIYDKIAEERDYLDSVIGVYSRDFNEFDDIIEPQSRYEKGNYAIRPALNDIDDRLNLIEELTDGGAGEIQKGINEYKRLVANILAQINGGQIFDESNTAVETVTGLKADIVSAEDSLKTTIITIQEDLSGKLGENGEFPTGLYADFKNYKDTLTSDFNLFELTLSLDLNDLKSEIGNYTRGEVPASGLRKEVEEIQTNVTNYLESHKLDLETKRDELIGNPASEEISATGIYKTIDDYTEVVSTKINDTVQKAEQAAKETEKLVNGDPEAEEGSDARKSLALRVADVSVEIQKAETAKNEVIAANGNLGKIRLHTRAGLDPQVSVDGPEATKDLTLGALNFYVQGYHWRGYAPALGSNEIQTIDTPEETVNSWRQAYNPSAPNTRDYAGAFGLNFGKSDTVDVSLNTRTYNKTEKVSDKYQIPTLEFEATNVVIQDGSAEGSPTSNILKIVMVTSDEYAAITDKKSDTFYFIKQS